MRRLATALAVAALAATGCGSDDPEPEAQAPTSATTTAPQADGPSTTEAQRTARNALLELGDFPDGWERRDEDDSDDKSEGDCPKTKPEPLAEARATGFSYGDDLNSTHFVLVHETAGNAARALTATLRPEVRTCTAERIRDRLADTVKDGVDVGDVETGELRVPDVGEESMGIRVTVPLSANGFTRNVRIDYVFARVGRGITVVQVVSDGDDEIRDKLAEVAVAKLARALGEEGEVPSGSSFNEEGDARYSEEQVAEKAGLEADEELGMGTYTFKGCDVSVVMTTRDAVELYADAGDAVVTNEAGDVGVKFFPEPGCREKLLEALSAVP